MNLIEQLGGYERAKEHLNDFNESFGYWCDLNKELLEYRREHGIYEVGDFIMFGGKLYEIKYIYHPEKARITGTVHDRDVNSALNILALGHERLAGGIPVL